MSITFDSEVIDEINLETRNTLRNLNNFLQNWDASYEKRIKIIPLFDINRTSKWNSKQKEIFVKTFYHIRGHFHDFLWYVGNWTTNPKMKEIIVQNIYEEFGKANRSHEQLYFMFAENMGVDLKDELINSTNYAPFAQEFNKDHMKWLITHDQDSHLAAFSAYERLDNIDYVLLSNLAKSIGSTDKSAIFFTIHTCVEHFQPTYSLLADVWKQNQDKVIQGFNFIADHQITMWENLSNYIFSYA